MRTYKQKVFLLWVWLKLEDKILLFNLITFLRQSVHLSGKIVRLDWISRTVCVLIRVNCSTWVNFSDKPSTYRCTCLLFSNKLSPCRCTYLITLSCVTSKHERNDWQLFLWLVFPFKVNLGFCGWSFMEFSRSLSLLGNKIKKYLL